MRAVTQPILFSPLASGLPDRAPPTEAERPSTLTLDIRPGRDYATLLASELRARALNAAPKPSDPQVAAKWQAARLEGERLVARFVDDANGAGGATTLDDEGWRRLVTYAAGGAAALARLADTRADLRRIRQAWRLHRGSDASAQQPSTTPADQRQAFGVLDHLAARELGFASRQARAGAEALLACYAARGEAGVVSCARLLAGRQTLIFYVGPAGGRRRARRAEQAQDVFTAPSRKRAGEPLALELMPPPKRQRLDFASASAASDNGAKVASSSAASTSSSRTLCASDDESSVLGASGDEVEASEASAPRLGWLYRWLGRTTMAG